MTQNTGSNPRHYLSRELTAIWLLHPKYTESLLLVWQTKKRLFIYEFDFFFASASYINLSGGLNSQVTSVKSLVVGKARPFQISTLRKLVIFTLFLKDASVEKQIAH